MSAKFNPVILRYSILVILKNPVNRIFRMFQDSHVSPKSRMRWPRYRSTDELRCAIRGGATAVRHTVVRAPARLQTADPLRLSLRIRVLSAGKPAVLPATRHRR